MIRLGLVAYSRDILLTLVLLKCKWYSLFKCWVKSNISSFWNGFIQMDTLKNLRKYSLASFSLSSPHEDFTKWCLRELTANGIMNITLECLPKNDFTVVNVSCACWAEHLSKLSTTIINLSYLGELSFFIHFNKRAKSLSFKDASTISSKHSSNCSGANNLDFWHVTFKSSVECFKYIINNVIIEVIVV